MPFLCAVRRSEIGWISLPCRRMQIVHHLQNAATARQYTTTDSIGPQRPRSSPRSIPKDDKPRLIFNEQVFMARHTKAAKRNPPLTKVCPSKLTDSGTRAGSCVGTAQTRTGRLPEPYPNVADTTAEPNDTRGVHEAREADGKPRPARVMTKPPSRDERPTVEEVTIGLTSDRLRGLQKRMV